MAGHSKWSNIKHKKAKEDKKRNKLFNKHLREISVAAREGGGDPEMNPRLDTAIENAKSDNVPKDNIERAIKKGTGELDEGDGAYEDATYEGYGPGGIAFFIEVTTNNYNRTVGSIRHIFTSLGGNLGTDGSVDYLFEQKGMIRIKKDEHDVDEEEFMLEAIDAGAEDIDADGEFFNVTTGRESMYEVRDELEDLDYEIESAELIRIPMTEVKVEPDVAESNFKLMNKFEDDDDVSNVFTNMKMDEETLAIAEQMD
ncbi:YebC/PmpR family DNA-binding transcriptional regulator [Fodinibius halophilus]|uniref:Probable transcriptional regulatory protein G3569_03630 n=1 Tax=Fodinibius halophilus TaxID=1736908 RepID=A0A6M1T2H2_9BACT|nr:YebC/PmpR family DNA-binding transcriptional regulator [Fodinibius halophilus]NGP87435.1 YebC/PmpR family DNA-binding transcriptional regulator [Fodinibius halophilus]